MKKKKKSAKRKKNPIFKGKSLETSGLLKILSHKEEKFVHTLQIRSFCAFSAKSDVSASLQI